jgi:hypothetical protein
MYCLDTGSPSAGQKIRATFGTLKVHYRLHKGLRLDPILSHAPTSLMSL